MSILLENLFRNLGRLVLPALAFAVLLGNGTVAVDAQTRTGSKNSITICHYTGIPTSPFVPMTADIKLVVEEHLDHGRMGTRSGDDIIPEFTFMGQTYSMNLSTDFGDGKTGAQILGSGCQLASVAASPSPTQRTPALSPPPTVPIPEPVTILLFGTGMASIGLAARRRFGKKASKEGEKEPE